jgi:competence protein ComEA
VAGHGGDYSGAQAYLVDNGQPRFDNRETGLKGDSMMARGGRFVFGLCTGVLASGRLYLLLAEPRGLPVELLPPPSPSPLRVHVAGAVRQSGVIELPVGAIVADAIEAAGGAQPGANLDALNLASQIEDGQRIEVPAQGTDVAQETTSGPAAGGRLDLNRATAAELEKLPGIGPSLAHAIVQFRERNGPFRSVEDLLNVPGIGAARLAQLQDLVQIE